MRNNDGNCERDLDEETIYGGLGCENEARNVTFCDHRACRTGGQVVSDWNGTHLLPPSKVEFSAPLGYVHMYVE